MTRRNSCVHVGLVIHMFNRSSGTLKGFSSIVSDFKMLVGLHDFADALHRPQRVTSMRSHAGANLSIVE